MEDDADDESAIFEKARGEGVPKVDALERCLRTYVFDSERF